MESHRGFDLTGRLKFFSTFTAILTPFWSGTRSPFRFISAFVPSSLDHFLTYRLIKLAGFISLTAAFALVLSKWIECRFEFLSDYLPPPIPLVHFLTLGSFMAYCHGSQTLSYNDFITFCLLGVSIVPLSIDLAPPQWSRLSWNFLVSMVA